MQIRLSWHEVSAGAAVGIRRHMEALRAELQDKYGFDGDGWGVHIEGACAEIAVAKALSVYWEPTVNTFRSGGDIGNNIQVRCRSTDDYDLLIRQNDKDEQIFILITGKIPEFCVRGWIIAGEAKRHPEWIREHGGRPPAWFVPQEALSPITDLKIS